MTMLEILGFLLLVGLGLCLVIAPRSSSAWMEKRIPVPRRRDTASYFDRRAHRILARVLGVASLLLGIAAMIAVVA